MIKHYVLLFFDYVLLNQIEVKKKKHKHLLFIIILKKEDKI